MGFIHRAVVAEIKKNNPSVNTELTLSNCGRADIVQLGIGAVWEVKHAGTSPYVRSVIAHAQASTYVELNDELTHLGQAGAFEGTFYIQCLDHFYEVEYCTPQPGVVLYSVNEVQNHNGTVSTVYVPKAERKKKPNKFSFGKALAFGLAGLALGASGASVSIKDDVRLGSCSLF